MAPSELLFWGALALIVHTYAGYPLWLELLARVRPRPWRPAPDADPSPRVTLLLVARAGDPRLPGRLDDLARSGYPHDRLRVVLVRDGGADPSAPPPPVCALPHEVIDLPPGSGKPAGLNAGLRAITEGLVVFTDVRQEFAPDAIPFLVRPFADPTVGAVSGSLEIRRAASAAGGGVDAYWRLERRIRWLESRTGSAVGCTGAIYAVRRGLLDPIPEDTWLDDVLIPMRVARRGFRVLFEPAARAFDPQPLEPALERVRKPRTLGGNFQLLFRHPVWGIPGAGPLAGRFFCHKVLRLAAPLLLLLVLVLPMTGWVDGPVIGALLILQLAAYLLGLAGLALRVRHPALRLPAGFLFLNSMVVRGFFFWLTHRGRGAWAGPVVST